MSKEKTKWEHITLGDYLTILQLQKEHPEDSAKYIIEYLYGVVFDELPIFESVKYVDKLSFLSEEISDTKLTDVYTINGRKYELSVMPQNFTYSQFMDWHTYGVGDDEDKLVKLLSVVLVPVGHKYADGYDMEEVYGDIYDLPITDANKISAFFLDLSHRWMKVLGHYLGKILKKTNLPKDKKEQLLTEVNNLTRYLHLR